MWKYQAGRSDLARLERIVWRVAGALTFVAATLSLDCGADTPITQVNQPGPGLPEYHAPEQVPASPSLPAQQIAPASRPTVVAPPAPEVGNLQVIVQVPEARVYVDGQYVGSASRNEPLSEQGFLPGNIEVKIEADGYRPLLTRTTIRPYEWTQLPVHLEPSSSPERMPDAWTGGSGPAIGSGPAMPPETPSYPAPYVAPLPPERPIVPAPYVPPSESYPALAPQEPESAAAPKYEVPATPTTRAGREPPAVPCVSRPCDNYFRPAYPDDEY